MKPKKLHSQKKHADPMHAANTENIYLNTGIYHNAWADFLNM